MDPALDKTQDKRAEADFFDQATADGRYDAFTQKAYDRLLLFFEKFVRPKAGEKVLDLGCGTGAFTEQLKRFGLDLTGADISGNALDLAKKINPDIKFAASDIERLSFKDGHFDIVVFSAALHHFGDFSGCASEARRVLKKEGRVFAFDPNIRNPLMRIYRNIHSAGGTDITVNERLLSAEELEKTLTKAGFSVSVIAASGIELRRKDRGIFDGLLPLYNILERGLAYTPLARRYGSHLITYGYKE